MNRNTKKGFTIVELIIVIAVIAVLAAVLIPTFSNLINQAQQAKDTALVSDLNKGLKMSGKNFDTMHDALTAVEENVGINVAKINAVATDSEILWDSVNQCFVYLKGGDTEPTYIPDSKTTDVKGDYDYWMISDKDADVKADKYSIYWNGADIAEITATTGFDAGEKNVAKILYQRADDAAAREVTIRTNGGELEVAAKTDKVHHFDIAQQVIVTKSAPHSYYENGTVVGNLEVVEGHVEISAKASVTTVIVASATENAATVTVASGATVGVVGATTDAGKTYLDNATTVPADKKAETKLDENTLSQFAGGIGTEASPYLIATTEQFKNISMFSAEMAKGTSFSFALVSDIDISNLTDWCSSKWWGNSVISIFSGNLYGNNNSLICHSTVDDSYFVFGDLAGNVQITDLVIKHKESIRPVRLNNGNLKGANILYKNVDVQSYDSNSVYEIENNGSLYTAFAGAGTYASTASFNNTANYTFENCDITLNLNSVGYTGLFLGQKIYGKDTKVMIKDCSYEGQYLGTQVSVLQGNSGNDGTLTVTGFVNKGTVGSTIGIPTIAGGSRVSSTTTREPLSGNVTYTDCNWGVMTYLHDDKLAISTSQDGLVITKASIDAGNNASYNVTIVGGTRFFYDANWNLTNAENSSFTFSVTVDNLNTPFVAGYYLTKKQFEALNVTSTKVGSYTTTIGDKFDLIKTAEGKYYYVFDFVGNFAFGTKDKLGNVTQTAVQTREATVMCFNSGILHATAKCNFVPTI